MNGLQSDLCFQNDCKEMFEESAQFHFVVNHQSTCKGDNKKTAEESLFKSYFIIRHKNLSKWPDSSVVEFLLWEIIRSFKL